MAGVKGRSGGNRPTAPQNNPANVSALGGNGQSGQPKRYISGMPYGQGQALMQQQAGAPMQQAPQTPSGGGQMSLASLPQATPLSAPTERPGEPITHGAPIGEGPNMVEGLPKPESNDPDVQMAREYYPLLQFWASQPGASQGTKDYVLHLGTLI